MKKQSIFCLILTASVLAAAPVLAAGSAVTSAVKQAEEAGAAEAAEEAAEAVEEVSSDSEEASILPIAPEIPDIYGQWYEAGTSGEYRLTLSSLYKLYILPDGNVKVSDELYAFESLGDNLYKVELPPEDAEYADAMKIELGTVEEGDMEKYGFSTDSYYLTSVGSPKITITVTIPDTSNPLATNASDLVGETILLKSYQYDDFIASCMKNKTFNIGSNVLTIDEDRNLDLNNGANTGTVFFGYNDQYAATVSFSWTSATIKYYVSSVSESEIVLVNLADESDVLTLTPAEAAEAPAETPAN